jgi:hypothetical protein
LDSHEISYSEFLFRFVDIVQFWLKSDENNGHFK